MITRGTTHGSLRPVTGAFGPDTRGRYGRDAGTTQVPALSRIIEVRYMARRRPHRACPTAQMHKLAQQVLQAHADAAQGSPTPAKAAERIAKASKTVRAAKCPVRRAAMFKVLIRWSNVPGANEFALRHIAEVAVGLQAEWSAKQAVG